MTPQEQYAEWLENTSVTGKPRSGALAALDRRLKEYLLCNGTSSPLTKQTLLRELKRSVEAWKQEKVDWTRSIRNANGYMAQMFERIDTRCTHEGLGAVAPLGKYKVARSVHATGGRRVDHTRQWKMMSCWWACISMLLDYRFGPDVRDALLSIAPTTERMKQANNGLSFCSTEGLQVMNECCLMDVPLNNLGTGSFQPADIRAGLVAYGPLIFSGQFVRLFKKRFYAHGHCIVVYGVSDKDVYYHDPGLGLTAFTASQKLTWHEFKNGWRDRGLVVTGVNPAIQCHVAGGLLVRQDPM